MAFEVFSATTQWFLYRELKLAFPVSVILNLGLRTRVPAPARSDTLGCGWHGWHECPGNGFCLSPGPSPNLPSLAPPTCRDHMTRPPNFWMLFPGTANYLWEEKQKPKNKPQLFSINYDWIYYFPFLCSLQHKIKTVNCESLNDNYLQCKQQLLKIVPTLTETVFIKWRGKKIK